MGNFKDICYSVQGDLGIQDSTFRSNLRNMTQELSGSLASALATCARIENNFTSCSARVKKIYHKVLKYKYYLSTINHRENRLFSQKRSFPGEYFEVLNNAMGEVYL